MTEVAFFSRFFAALLLILGAGLKTYQLSTVPDPSNYVLGSHLLTTLLVLVEIGVATWLLSGAKPRIAKWAALTLFSLFAVTAAAKWTAGETNCGCFGVIQIHPAIVFFVDAFVIVVLLDQCIRRARTDTKASGFKSSLVWVCGFIFAAFCIVSIQSLRTTSFNDLGLIETTNDFVILEPETWVGQQLPIIEYLKHVDKYALETCHLLFYYEDCPHCKQYIATCLETPETHPFVFVEVPPYKAPDQQNTDTVTWAKLDDRFKWFVEAPVELTIENGMVSQVRTRDQLEN